MQTFDVPYSPSESIHVGECGGSLHLVATHYINPDMTVHAVISWRLQPHWCAWTFQKDPVALIWVIWVTKSGRPHLALTAQYNAYWPLTDLWGLLWHWRQYQPRYHNQHWWWVSHLKEWKKRLVLIQALRVKTTKRAKQQCLQVKTLAPWQIREGQI